MHNGGTAKTMTLRAPRGRAGMWSLTAALAVAGIVLRAQTPASPPNQSFRERVDVSRVLVDVRVLDRVGRAITGLGPSDFAVTIDGKAAYVDAATWVPETSMPSTSGTPAATPSESTAPQRWLVIVVQRKVERGEMVGLMRVANDAADFAAWFAQGGRVAVVSFDSQLHAWADFTTDVVALRRVLTQSIIAGRPPRDLRIEAVTDSVRAPLVTTGDQAPASLSAAMQRIGEMLELLPGTKSVVVFGAALGTWVPRLASVDLGQEFDSAVTLLQRARISVFCFDYTDAEYHPRQEGLVQLASDTGGRFWQTDRFTSGPLTELRDILTGRYELFVIPPDDRIGWRTLGVKVVNRRARVLAKPGYLVEAH